MESHVRAKKHAVHVHTHQRIPFGFRNFVRWFVRAADAHIVDEHINLAEFPDNSVEGICDFVLYCDVHVPVGGSAALGDDFIGKRSAAPVHHVGDCDRRAFAGKQQRRCASDAERSPVTTATFECILFIDRPRRMYNSVSASTRARYCAVYPPSITNSDPVTNSIRRRQDRGCRSRYRRVRRHALAGVARQVRDE